MEQMAFPARSVWLQSHANGITHNDGDIEIDQVWQKVLKDIDSMINELEEYFSEACRLPKSPCEFLTICWVTNIQARACQPPQ